MKRGVYTPFFIWKEKRLLNLYEVLEKVEKMRYNTV